MKEQKYAFTKTQFADAFCLCYSSTVCGTLEYVPEQQDPSQHCLSTLQASEKLNRSAVDHRSDRLQPCRIQPGIETGLRCVWCAGDCYKV
jgi:hypothetical protein